MMTTRAWLGSADILVPLLCPGFVATKAPGGKRMKWVY
jgi:hypothetical protein